MRRKDAKLTSICQAAVATKELFGSKSLFSSKAAVLRPQRVPVDLRPLSSQQGATEGMRQDSYLVVDARSPFRIFSADKRWLRRFGFKSTEAKGRSIRICFGPETDVSIIDGLIANAVAGAQEMEGIWSKATLYHKSGDVKHMLLQVQPEPADDQGAPARARLCMRSVSGAPQDQTGQGLPTVWISSAPPHPVVTSNQAFLDLYGIAAAQMLNVRGVKLIWGPSTDCRRWGTLIQHALKGEIRTCLLNTYTCEGQELSVYVTIGPVEPGGSKAGSELAEAPRHLLASFVLEPEDCEEDPTTSSDSTSSGGQWDFASSDSSRGSTTSCPHEGSPTNSTDNHEVALQVHLRALRRHKLAKSESSTSLHSFASSTQDGLEMETLKTAVVECTHSRSWTSISQLK